MSIKSPPPLKIFLLATLISLVSSTVEIPNTGGFFYASLNTHYTTNSTQNAAVIDGYLNLNVSISGQQFSLSLDPYSYSLSVVKENGAFSVPNKFSSTGS